jgi:NAD(P)H dehydrogenase (quinone)
VSKVLLVVAHARRDSLTHQAARKFARVLADEEHVVEFADLVAEGFDPILREADEPEWSNSAKVYSEAVLREIARIRRNEATVLIFPVYWWAMPAVLKGWIDRVWNHGFAYGAGQYPHRRVWMIGIAGNQQADFEKRGYDRAMLTSLRVGILNYCSVGDPRLELLYGSIEGPQFPPRILERTEALAHEFCALSKPDISLNRR